MEELANEIREHLIKTCKGKSCETWHFPIRDEAIKYLSVRIGHKIENYYNTTTPYSFYLTYKEMSLFYIEIKRKKAQEYRRYFESQFNYNDFIVKPIQWGITKPLDTIQQVIEHINEREQIEQVKKQERRELVKLLFNDVKERYNLQDYEARKLLKEASNYYDFYN